jgi:hypothetical protein
VQQLLATQIAHLGIGYHARAAECLRIGQQGGADRISTHFETFRAQHQQARPAQCRIAIDERNGRGYGRKVRSMEGHARILMMIRLALTDFGPVVCT